MSNFVSNLIENDFDLRLIRLYTDTILSKEDIIEKIDSNLVAVDGCFYYYLADNYQIYLVHRSKTRIYEVDVKSAAYTICMNWFSNNRQFISKLESLKDNKLKRNIFLTNAIKSSNQKLLRTINTLYKIITLGSVLSVMNKHSVFQILELKKDGVILACDSNTAQNIEYINEIQNDFLSQIRKFEFSFNVNEYLGYIRAYKTTYVLTTDHILIRKGKYKYVPPFIDNFQIKTFLQEETKSELDQIKKIYTNTAFGVIKLNNLNELIDKYIKCGNNGVLTKTGSYSININDSDPTAYRKYMIYPVILYDRRHKYYGNQSSSDLLLRSMPKRYR